MYLSKTNVIDTLQWLLTVVLIASFLLFNTFTWGKYLIILFAVLIFLLAVIKNGGRIRLRLGEYIIFLVVFTAYTAFTAIWAISASDALTMARTLLRLCVCLSLVYWAYMYDEDPYRLLSALVVASYVVAVYTVFVYGFSDILHASDIIFTTESFANINSLALFLSLGVVCDLYLLLYRGFRVFRLISILSIIIIAFTRSRKAIVFLALGFLLLLLFRFASSKRLGYRIFKISMIIIFALIAVYFVSKLPIFSGVNVRLEQMLNTFKGSGKMDTSSLLRNDLIRVGWFIFGKRPLTGIGMGCTHIVAFQHLNVDAYLHNNYLELLAGGGIPAFVLYYSMYVYLIVGFFRIRKIDYQWFSLGITVILLTLITDYGRVAYYSGSIQFQIMALFLILNIVKRNRKEISENDEAVEVCS